MGRGTEYSILGIDPGSHRTGIALIGVAGQNFTRSWYTVLELDEKSKAARLAHLIRSVGEIVLRYRPDVVGIESGFVGKGWQTSLTLAEARGAIIATVAKKGIPLFELPPATVKVSVGVGGRGSKDAVTGAVRAIFGLKQIPSSDEGDALAVAVATANRWQGERIYGAD